MGPRGNSTEPVLGVVRLDETSKRRTDGVGHHLQRLETVVVRPPRDRRDDLARGRRQQLLALPFSPQLLLGHGLLGQRFLLLLRGLRVGRGLEALAFPVSFGVVARGRRRSLFGRRSRRPRFLT